MQGFVPGSEPAGVPQVWLLSYPSAKALSSLFCIVSNIGLLRQSETFWIHIIRSFWGPTETGYFVLTYSEHLKFPLLFYFPFTWKQAKQVGKQFSIHLGGQEQGKLVGLFLQPLRVVLVHPFHNVVDVIILK